MTKTAEHNVFVRCDSISPDGEQCSKREGHVPKKHQVKRDGAWDVHYWRGGRSGNKPHWPQPQHDPNDISEGERWASRMIGF